MPDEKIKIEGIPLDRELPTDYVMDINAAERQMMEMLRAFSEDNIGIAKMTFFGKEAFVIAERMELKPGDDNLVAIAPLAIIFNPSWKDDLTAPFVKGTSIALRGEIDAAQGRYTAGVVQKKGEA